MSLEERVKYAEMKARHKNILRPWFKKWWGVFILIIASLFLILLTVSAFYLVNQIKEIRQGEDLSKLEEQRQIILTAISGNTNYFAGTSKPQITIVEFGDFACPFCKDSEDGLKPALNKYSNQIKLVWRDYPLHPTSIELALAARCAGEQGKFWLFHDLLFSEQGKLATTTGQELNIQLSALAQSLGLNTGSFANCLSSQKYLDQIRRDFSDGETLQIQGTPTWFINNYPITGNIPADQFPILIQGLIK